MEAIAVQADPELMREASTYERRVAAIVVKDEATFREAGEIVIDLKTLEKKIKDYWREPKAQAQQAHKTLCARENAMLGPVVAGYRGLESRISAYLTAQERARQEEQRRIDAERAEAERKAKEKLLRAAEAADAKGKTAKADALLEQAAEVHIPQAIASPVVPKTTRTDSGTVTQRTETVVDVVDVKKLCEQIALGNVPPGVVTFNAAKLKEFVRQWGHKSFPGLSIREEQRGTFRGR